MAIVGEVKVLLTGDSAKLVSAARSAESALSKLDSGSAKVSTALSKLGGAGGKAASLLGRVRGALAKAGLVKAKSQAMQFEQSLSGLSRQLGVVASKAPQVGRLAGAFQRVGAAARRMGLKKAKSDTEKLNGSMGKLSGRLKGVAAGFIGLQSIRAGAQLATSAAATNDAARAFENAGNSLQDFRRATKGLVSDATLVKKANLGRAMGITGDQFKELAKIALASSKITGQSVEFLTDSIVTGTARQSRLILDNLGIIVSATDANEAWAKANGRTVASLSDVEKKLAFTNAVMRAGNPLIAEAAKLGDTAAEEFNRMKASAANAARELGTVLIPVFLTLGDTLKKAINFWKEFAEVAVTGSVAIATAADPVKVKLQERLVLLRKISQEILNTIPHQKKLQELGRKGGDLFAARAGIPGLEGKTLQEALAQVNLSIVTIRKTLRGMGKAAEKASESLRENTISDEQQKSLDDFLRRIKDIKKEVQGFGLRGAESTLFQLAERKKAARAEAKALQGPGAAEAAIKALPAFNAGINNMARKTVEGVKGIEDFTAALRFAVEKGLLGKGAAGKLATERTAEELAGRRENLAKELAGISIGAMQQAGAPIGPARLTADQLEEQRLTKELKKLSDAAEDAARDIREGLTAGGALAGLFTGDAKALGAVEGTEEFGKLSKGVLGGRVPGFSKEDSAVIAKGLGESIDGGETSSVIAGTIGKLIGGAGGAIVSAVGAPVVDGILQVFSVAADAVQKAFKDVSNVVSKNISGTFDNKLTSDVSGSMIEVFGAAASVAFAAAATGFALQFVPVLNAFLLIPVLIAEAFAPVLIPLAGLAVVALALGAAFLTATKQTKSFDTFQRAMQNVTAGLTEAFEPFFERLLFIPGVLSLVADAAAVLVDVFFKFNDGTNILFNALKFVGIIAILAITNIAQAINIAINTIQQLGGVVLSAVVGIAQMNLGIQNFLESVGLGDANKKAIAAAQLASAKSAFDSFNDVFSDLLIDVSPLNEIANQLRDATLPEMIALGQGLADLDDTTKDLNSEMTNVPQGFKVARERFLSTKGDKFPNADLPGESSAGQVLQFFVDTVEVAADNAGEFVDGVLSASQRTIALAGGAVPAVDGINTGS